MAFANLFSGLSAVRADVNTAAGAEHPRRNEEDDGKRGRATKRKSQSEHTWSRRKKQHDQLQESSASKATSFKGGHLKELDHQKKTANSGGVSVGFAGAVVHKQGKEGTHHAAFHNSQSHKAQNVYSKRQQGKNNKNKKYQHHPNEPWRRANGGGGHQRQTWKPERFKGDRNNKQDVKVKRSRLMTQEFKDQNVIVVNEQMLCRHFLFGKCIKGDECQLQHTEGFNDLIKKICKFYVQRLCTKGDKCPYMHKSFPCKFFHGRGRCPQGEGCRFSHDPLNDTTKPLLEEVLRADQLLREQAEKTEQASSEQPAHADDPESAEATETPDTLTQPFKLNFYNSGESGAFRPNFYNSEETNAAEEAVSCSPDTVADAEEEAHQAHETHLQPHNSASDPSRHGEGVLGEAAQDRNKPSFGLSSPGCEDSSSVSVPRTSSALAPTCQSPAPYSVEAVFRACKSLRSSTFSYSAASPAETPSPGVKSEPLHSGITVAQTSGDKTEGPARQKCSSRSKSENGQLPSDDPHGAGSSGEALQSSGKVLCSLFSKPPSAVSPLNRSAHPKPTYSMAPPPSQSFYKGGSGAIGSSESTKNIERGLKRVAPRHPTGSQAHSKTSTGPFFKSLFASSIIGPSTPDSATATAGPPGSARSSQPAPDPTDLSDTQTAVEPDRSRTRSVCSLFVTPLAGITPQPSTPPLPADLDASPPRPGRTEDPNVTRTPAGKISTKLANQPTVDSHPATSRQELSRAAATSTSVLKGLFVSLGPFQLDGQTQESVGRSDASERQRDQQRPQKKNSRKKKTV